MNLIPAFLRNLFKPKTTFVPPTTAVATTPVNKRQPQFPRVRQRGPRRKTLWLARQLEGYAGERTIIVRVPAHLDMSQAQNMVSGFMHYHYGKGKFTTRRFESARTVHISPR